MIRRTLTFALAAAILLAGQPLSAAAALKRQTGELSGTAVIEGRPLADIMVRLRNVDTGQIVATTRTNDRGEFKFAGLPIANYVVETVANDRVTVLGMSPRIAITASSMVATGVTVSTSAAAAAAAGLTTGAGAAGAGAGAAAHVGGGAGAFFHSTAGIVTLVAVGGGILTAVAVTKNNASPSR